MSILSWRQEGSKTLTLKELVEQVERALFLGESVQDPRNAEISKALYAAIMLKHLVGLEQFASDPSIKEEVREVSGKIQSILELYPDAEAKDIAPNDLDTLLSEVKKLPEFHVIKENTQEKSIMILNFIAQSLAILQKAIPRLEAEHSKRSNRI